MKRSAALLSLLFFALLVGVLLSGCGNPAKINSVVTQPQATLEGESVTITAEVEQLLGDVTLTLEAVVAIFKPANFFVKNDRTYLWSPNLPNWTNYATKVTVGPAIDALNAMRRKMALVPGSFITYEAIGYDYWVGVSKDPVTLDVHDKVLFLATLEGGVGDTRFFVFSGTTASRIDPSLFKGTGKAYVINPSNNQVVGSDLIGASSGLFGRIAISETSGKIFVSSPYSVSVLDANFGLLTTTNIITNLDATGSYVTTEVLPHDHLGDPKFALRDIVWCNGKIYAMCTYGNGSDDGEIRIYNEDGTEVAYSPYTGLSGVGVSNDVQRQRFICAARKVGSTAEVYFISEDNMRIVAFYDDGSGAPSHSVINLPHYTNSITLLGNGGFAVSGGKNLGDGTYDGHVTVFDSANNIIAMVTPEVGAAVVSPTWAVDDPARGKLYVAQSIGGGTHIWIVSYEADSATLEAVINENSVFGYFGFDPVGNRLYVPLINQGRIDVVNPVTRSHTYAAIGGYPVFSLVTGGKVYSADVGRAVLGSDPAFLLTLMGDPPEIYQNKIKVFPVNNLSSITEINVGYLPCNMATDGSKIVVISGALPGAFLDFKDSSASFEWTAPPEIVSAEINGGVVVNGDYISNSPVLTADLTDNSNVWSARVWVDNVDMTSSASFEPSLPADKLSRMRLNIGSLSAAITHSITIEITDRVASDTWEVFGLRVLGGTAEVWTGYPVAYPAVFKPKTGNADERTLRIAYMMSADLPITIMMVDVTGKAVFTRKYSAATMGGRAGYNEISWNGRTDTGGIIGNGIYPYKIVSKGKILGKGKIVVYE